MSQLNPKQLRFIDEYMIDLNAKQAAIRAGYSEKTAKEQASRLLTNVNVKKEVAKRRGMLQEKAQTTLDDIIAELDENRKYALTAETPQSAAATAATMAKAKLLGLVVEKTETKHSGEVGISHKLDTSNLSTEELRTLANIRLTP